MIIASIEDFREAARRRLPRFLFEYFDGGSFRETTLARNTADLADIALRQRVLRGLGTVSLSTRLFGEDIAIPVVLAPIGLAGLAARRGEQQAVRAAQAAGVPFTLSTVGVCNIEEVASAATRPFWFQLYMLRDRGFMAALLDRAAAAGCTTLVFTVDMPVAGSRYRDVRSGLAGMPGWRGAAWRAAQALARPRWAWDVGVNGRPHTLGNVDLAPGRSRIEDFLGWLNANFDPSIAWRDLEWVRARWKGPMVIKGVLDPADALEAAKLGADGLVVSNHGGRQLDGVLSSARALPRIVDAVSGRMTVLADGGVRSGLDVLRMLALGASGVMLGRAWAWALGARGEAGVAQLLRIIEAEMRAAMTLAGVGSISDIGRDLIDG